jgi:DNA-binding transcriptional ArsR family regulator
MGGKVEIRSNGLYVVGEGSINPNGVPYYPVNSINTLPVFKIGPLPSFDSIILEADFSPASMKEILALSGFYEKRFESRSESEMSIITLMVRKGYSKDSIASFLSKTLVESKFVELLNKNESRAFAWLDVSIKKAEELPHTEEFSNVKEETGRLKELLSKSALTGRNGASLYKVLLAHLDTCQRSGKRDYHLSVREACEKVGLSHLTFIKQNNLVISEGIVEAVNRSRGIKGNSYKINVEEMTKWLEGKITQNLSSYNNNIVTNCDSYGKLGLFEYKSMGHSANQIYNAINEIGVTTGDIVSQTGRSYNTVIRVLKKLEESGLVKKEKRKYSRIDADLTKLSYDRGYLAKAAKRRYNHKRERIMFRERKNSE